jgi:hypothetical protein
MSDSKKGRPTPRRKDAQPKRHTLAPVVTKLEKKRLREETRIARAASREAYMRGEESALPARDRGPARRFIRDYIDARRSIGEYFLPIIFLVLLLTLIPTSTTAGNGVPITQLLSIGVMYSVLIVSVIDGVILTRKIRKEITARFPDTPVKGLGMYGWLRSTQMRRMRTPKPQVKAGAKL